MKFHAAIYVHMETHAVIFYNAAHTGRFPTIIDHQNIRLWVMTYASSAGLPYRVTHNEWAWNGQALS